MITLGGLQMSAQGYRIRYGYYHRADTTRGYLKQLDMNLDYFYGETAFYSENTYLCDSLSIIAFDDKGNIKNEDAYSELTRHITGNFREYTFVNYKTSEYSLIYNLILTIRGKGSLEMPEWNITEETKLTSSGYTCRRATANYLGRQWRVWYTDEIPINVGPWLLWGAPGLIVDARDSEELFVFKLFGIEQLEDNHRIEILKDFVELQKGRYPHRFYDYGVKECEFLHNKLENDDDFAGQITGVVSTTVYDKNGNQIENFVPTYEPLIPSEYWKDK